jgi:hypothetical protein
MVGLFWEVAALIFVQKEKRKFAQKKSLGGERNFFRVVFVLVVMVVPKEGAQRRIWPRSAFQIEDPMT